MARTPPNARFDQSEATPRPNPARSPALAQCGTVALRRKQLGPGEQHSLPSNRGAAAWRLRRLSQPGCRKVRRRRPALLPSRPGRARNVVSRIRLVDGAGATAGGWRPAASHAPSVAAGVPVLPLPLHAGSGPGPRPSRPRPLWPGRQLAGRGERPPPRRGPAESRWVAGLRFCRTTAPSAPALCSEGCGTTGPMSFSAACVVAGVPFPSLRGSSLRCYLGGVLRGLQTPSFPFKWMG